jgi:hypothetical protein
MNGAADTDLPAWPQGSPDGERCKFGASAAVQWVMSAAPETVPDLPVEVPYVLGLKPGERVRLRPAAEIFATLDEKGTLEGPPFMPEMVKYCGRMLLVTQRAGVNRWSRA